MNYYCYYYEHTAHTERMNEHATKHKAQSTKHEAQSTAQSTAG